MNPLQSNGCHRKISFDSLHSHHVFICLRKCFKWSLCELGGWCTFNVLHTDGIDSLPLSGVAFMALKDVTQVTATIVATYFSLGSHPHVAHCFGIVTRGIRVPTGIFEFAGRGVQRMTTTLAGEMPGFGEVSAVVSFAICFGAALSENAELFGR